MTVITIQHVRQALTLPDFDPQAAQLRMAPQPRPTRRSDQPGTPRLAGVLILLYPAQQADDKLMFALMRRPDYDGVHSGQISLPGGRHEGDESFVQTALREACEEVGVCGGIEVLGTLTELYIPPSDFLVYPTVGYCSERPQWQLDPAEVAELLEVPVHLLFDNTIKGSEEVFRTEINRMLTIYYYRLHGHKVWGATAAILSEFESRLRQVLDYGGIGD